MTGSSNGTKTRRAKGNIINFVDTFLTAVFTSESSVK